MTKLNKEQQADYEHAIDMAQDLIDDDDNMEVISLNSYDSLEFLKHLLSSKDNN